MYATVDASWDIEIGGAVRSVRIKNAEGLVQDRLTMFIDGAEVFHRTYTSGTNAVLLRLFGDDLELRWTNDAMKMTFGVGLFREGVLLAHSGSRANAEVEATRASIASDAPIVWEVRTDKLHTVAITYRERSLGDYLRVEVDGLAVHEQPIAASGSLAIRIGDEDCSVEWKHEKVGVVRSVLTSIAILAKGSVVASLGPPPIPQPHQIGGGRPEPAAGPDNTSVVDGPTTNLDIQRQAGAVTLLILSATPDQETPLRVDREQRAIKDELDRSEIGRQFTVRSSLATRYHDIQRELLMAKPTVLHFAGHGDTGGIFVENDRGKKHLIPTQALADLLSIPMIRQRLRVVVLNACWTQAQANAIRRRIKGMVVGMSHEVSEDAAIEFSRGLYGALGNPEIDLETAFVLGRNNVMLAGLVDQAYTPVRFKSQGFETEGFFIAQSSA